MQSNDPHPDPIAFLHFIMGIVVETVGTDNDIYLSRRRKDAEIPHTLRPWRRENPNEPGVNSTVAFPPEIRHTLFRQ